MAPPQVRVERVSAIALVEDKGFNVIDTQGRKLSRRLSQDQFEVPVPIGITELRGWNLAAKKMAQRGANKAFRFKTLDEWRLKLDILSASFRIRGYRQQRTRTRSNFVAYSTLTWTEAIDRMRVQGRSHHRHHSISPWTRWAYCVSNNHRKRTGGVMARVTSTQLRNLIERQGYLCALSGRELTPETASLDHIIPLSRGGEHSINNVWIVDLQVNNAKGTMTEDEFIRVCRDVTEYQRQNRH